MRLCKSHSIDASALYAARQLPTLPGRYHPSTIGVKRLNFCVRYGNRCVPLAIVTRRKLLSQYIVQFTILNAQFTIKTEILRLHSE